VYYSYILHACLRDANNPMQIVFLCLPWLRAQDHDALTRILRSPNGDVGARCVTIYSPFLFVHCGVNSSPHFQVKVCVIKPCAQENCSL
jgi:hypothetical protein